VRQIRLLLCVVAVPLAALVAGSASSAAASPVASIARACSVASNGEKLGPTYVESLSVHGTSCSVGYRTITAYNNCRLRHGGRAGHCNTPVLGFRCRDIRTSSPTQFVAKATCTKPRQSVVFTYSENT
jgi:hypothetical protein